VSRGPVLAISGPPGAGKTRLSREVAARLGWRAIAYDDYERQTRRPPAEIRDWIDRGAPFDEIPAPGLAEALAGPAAGTVFDTPLGRAYPATAGLIDASVVIACPADIALSRKLAQLGRGVESGQEAGFVAWLTGYLDAYESVVQPAIAIQTARLAGTADLVVSCEAPPLEIVETILAFCRDRFR